MNSDCIRRVAAATWVGVLFVFGVITGCQATAHPIAEGYQTAQEQIAFVTFVNDQISIQTSNKPNAPEWLTAIGTIGAVVVALALALWGQWINQLCFRPILNLEAKVRLPDATKVRRQAQLSDSSVLDLGEYYYFRLAITNTGNKAANDVQVFLSKVERLNGDQAQTVTRFTPMNLIWTNTEHLPAKDRVTRAVLLADTPPLYCDLAHVGDPKRRSPLSGNLESVPQGKAVLGLDVEVPTYLKGHLLEPGTYCFYLTLAASNCASTHYVVKVWFPGDWFPDEKEMFERGFKMEKL